MRASIYALPVAALALAFTPLACDDDGGARPIGAACQANGQCVSGVCGGGTCLTPDGDDDGDLLINSLEAALGTNPVEVDSDGDGKGDAAEVGSDVTTPTDFDGDGKPDAAESLVFDSDYDCIPDERDGSSSQETDLAEVADLSCCCAGRCSDLDVGLVEAECIPGEGGGEVTLGCRTDEDCDGGTCEPDGTCVSGMAPDPGGSSDGGRPGEQFAPQSAAPQRQPSTLVCTFMEGEPTSGAAPCGGGTDREETTDSGADGSGGLPDGSDSGR